MGRGTHISNAKAPAKMEVRKTAFRRKKVLNWKYRLAFWEIGRAGLGLGGRACRWRRRSGTRRLAIGEFPEYEGRELTAPAIVKGMGEKREWKAK